MARHPKKSKTTSATKARHEPSWVAKYKEIYERKFKFMKDWVKASSGKIGELEALKRPRGRPRDDEVKKHLDMVFEKGTVKKFLMFFLDKFEKNEGNVDDEEKVYSLWVFLHYIAGDKCNVDLFLERFLEHKIMDRMYAETHRNLNFKSSERKVLENLKKMFNDMNKNRGCFNRKFLVYLLSGGVNPLDLARIAGLSEKKGSGDRYVRQIIKEVKDGKLDPTYFYRRYAPLLTRTRVKAQELGVFELFLDEETFNRSGRPLERIQLQQDYVLYQCYSTFIEDYNAFQKLKNPDSHVEIPTRCYKVFSSLKKKYKVKKMKVWDMHFRCCYCHAKKMLERENKKLVRKLATLEEKLKLNPSNETLKNHKLKVEQDLAKNSLEIKKINDTHVLCDKNQRAYVKEKERTLGKDELLVFQDYLTVNWSIYDMCIVVMRKNDKDEKEFSYVHYVSPTQKQTAEGGKMGGENKNDSHYTIDCWKDFLKIVESKFPSTKKITIVSDGGPHHYKTGIALYYFSTLPKKTKMKLEYVFLCPHHGANYCDTCFGRMKKVIHNYERIHGSDINNVTLMVEVCEKDTELSKHDWVVTLDIPKSGYSLVSNTFPKGIKIYFGIDFTEKDGEIVCRELSGKGDGVKQIIRISEEDGGEYVPPEELPNLSDTQITDEIREKEKLEEKEEEEDDSVMGEKNCCEYCDHEISDEEEFNTCVGRKCGCVVHITCTMAGKKVVNNFKCKFCKRGIHKKDKNVIDGTVKKLFKNKRKK